MGAGPPGASHPSFDVGRLPAITGRVDCGRGRGARLGCARWPVVLCRTDSPVCPDLVHDGPADRNNRHSRPIEQGGWIGVRANPTLSRCGLVSQCAPGNPLRRLGHRDCVPGVAQNVDANGHGNADTLCHCARGVGYLATLSEWGAGKFSMTIARTPPDPMEPK